MKSLIRKINTKIFILINFFIFLIILKIYHYRYSNVLVLEHECACLSQKRLFVKVDDKSNYLVETDSFHYGINYKNFDLTCDLYKSLRRGPNQKIIAYSLYGKNSLYYNLISNLTYMVRKFYPDYVMRIYHDDTINKSIICELECANSNVDFCNIHKIPLNLDKQEKFLDLKYIHSMIWRFLPIGDMFVDLFISRDTDSIILKREYDSVQEWINSANLGHIMRDHPQHGTHILGGMWGFKVNKDRSLAIEIYKQIIDKTIASKYNPLGSSKKGYDQFFLSDIVYKRIKDKSTIHDSYLCSQYKDSKAFPTKREGDCFIGRVGFCNETAIASQCPKECRPINHQDWETC